nr:hypothetical protein [Endozoicomonas sp. ONNA2]
MNGVMGNGAVLPRNCSAICIDDERIRGQFGGHSLVETSCKPQPHVFHPGCITRHLDKQGETRLDQHRCSECGQPLLPLIGKDGESVDDDESPYCESRMLNVCRSGNLRKLNWHLDKDKTLANQPYRSALSAHRSARKPVSCRLKAPAYGFSPDSFRPRCRCQCRRSSG